MLSVSIDSVGGTTQMLVSVQSKLSSGVQLEVGLFVGLGASDDFVLAGDYC